MKYKKTCLTQGTMRDKLSFINLYRNYSKLLNMYDVLKISSKTYYNIEIKKINIIMII